MMNSFARVRIIVCLIFQATYPCVASPKAAENTFCPKHIEFSAYPKVLRILPALEEFRSRTPDLASFTVFLPSQFGKRQILRAITTRQRNTPDWRDLGAQSIDMGTFRFSAPEPRLKERESRVRIHIPHLYEANPEQWPDDHVIEGVFVGEFMVHDVRIFALQEDVTNQLVLVPVVLSDDQGLPGVVARVGDPFRVEVYVATGNGREW